MPEHGLSRRATRAASALRRRGVALVATAGAALVVAPLALAANGTTAGGATGQHVNGDGVADTALETGPQLSGAAGALTRSSTPGQHPGGTNHLPPVADDIDLVGKLRLTDVTGGIADVAAFGNHAYLAAWAPECLENEDPKARGGGVHVVDVSNPVTPRKVGFAPAPPNTYVGEGVHVFHMETASFKGDVLLMNHEGCDTDDPYNGGFSAYDVTNPANPVPLVLGAGEPVENPATHPDEALTHSAHSVQGWWTGSNAYLVLIDNQDLDDIDIFDITDPRNPRLISETGFEDYPEAQAPLENGQTVFIHDAQIKQIGGRWLMQVSYWDAGYITLDVTDPANPRYVADSDPPRPDPLTGQQVPEGNAHQSYWSADNKYIVAADEDFAPFRTLFQITEGEHRGPQSAGEFGWTVPIDQKFPNGLRGPTIYGGSGCPEDANGNGTSDRNEVPPASDLEAEEGEAKIVVFTRGVCFFSQKVESGQLAGYDAVLVGNSHAGSRNGLLPEAFICGSMGHQFTVTVSGLCVGHKATHDLFDDEPNYTGNNFADIPIGAEGARISATTEFDGWGYVHLLDANTLQEVDAYAVDEALDPKFASGFGDLSVHENKTDPTEGLAYISYYSAGVRVAQFGAHGIEETGAFIDTGGNDIWGIAPTTINNERLILASDRDTGLYVLRYVGPGAPKPPVCESQRQFVQSGTPERITLACADVNGNPLTFSVLDAPDNGTLGAIQGNQVTYTPRAGFRGEDTFTFRASDGSLVSNTATVRLVVGACSNRLTATEGPDLLVGTTHGDAVSALGGDDKVATGQGADCLAGDAGRDELDGGTDDDQITGGLGRDRLFGGAGEDIIRGNQDRDHINGGSGNDRLRGDAGSDFLAGGSNNDTLLGGSGADSLRGETGNDRINGGAGNDSINAGKGGNRINAGSGNDKVYAVNGRRDRITCGTGRDTVRADRRDRVAKSCEVVRRTRVTRRS